LYLATDMRIGLFFGSFNPIHNGHLMIASYLAETTDLDQVWFVVSPQNPFKKKESLLNEYDRLHMVRLGIGDNIKLRASDIEFKLPRPSYTIDTLVHIEEKFPMHSFCLIMGGDNLQTLHKWKNYEQIIRRFPVYVYKREGALHNPFEGVENVQLLDVPLLNISASFVREHIARGISMQYFVPEKVWENIVKENWYR
jgi:nicotinate-nucleotide adenylyltransferase